ncbi:MULTISPECIES: dihydrodipicolinate synthase family protein [unclassified Pseudactinotalea]|uniref:dihydrodipicolinate synthase family protein n=1 Tax=unclassified Pseudactinotalea TaxID=2649176 RepID=UPI00128D1940|nr:MULTISPECIES: dihydrodipicolinate synthase family protein [unclassified Pseudactinotalea]MPV48941.1 dihydrodipicolinate synthase family protein [Pseudactinotalea sp. HY160]QGH68377.1 dihydrodipicolinate synthase family protein [Pseudactinotalea sp. HY158]
MTAALHTAGSTTLRGVIPPLVTPLTPEGHLDVPSLERVIDHHLAGGVDGLFVLGSSGEVAYFEDEMREAVLTAAIRIVDGRVPVLAGCIDMQTRRVLAHARRAEELGAAGVVVTAPFYAITGPEEIEAHFRAIGAATDLPLFAYDLPVCVHVKLDGAMLVRLGSEGVLAGVKDSSGDDVAYRRLIAANRAAGSPLVLLTGHEVVVDGTYLAGGDGSVPGLGNVDPAGYVRLDRAARAGDWDAVRLEQDRLAALFEIVFAVEGKTGPAAGVGAFKTALWLMGIFDTNTMSAPMTALEGANIERVRAVLASLEIPMVR